MVILDPEELSSLSGCEVVFKNISVNINNKPILQNVSGLAKPGEVLAIMGPSGSGKTTLLSIIAGRRNDLESGTVMLNNQKLTKRLRRRISYVLQDDIFFANITLIDTLKYAAMLCLPASISKKEKLEKVDAIVDALDLRKCLNTVIGSTGNKGLSGGEKKRANIACELLTDPVILLLDEPTTGLDSSIAYSLMWSLKQYARIANKTVITSIHQPSSQIFHLFDQVLLLQDGETAYFGQVQNVMNYFSHIGLTCVEHYNPADFVMEKLKGTEDEILRIKEEGKKASWELLEDIEQTNPPTESSALCNNTDSINIDIIPDGEVIDSKKKWPTSFLDQYLILIMRSFKQSKSTILNKSKYIECIMVSITISLIWWQLGFDEEDIMSRMGLLTFYMPYWCFTITLVAIIVFPSEKIVMFKERSAGMYRLSAYYLSKNTSELPLLILLPIISILIVYWSTGLNQSASAFFSFMALLLLTVFASQALGQAVSIAWLDFEKSLSTAAIAILFSLMLTGFYVDDFPVWVEWTKYTSFLYYAYHASLIIEFTDNGPFRCTLDYSVYEECQNNSTYISTESILEEADVHLPLWLDYLFLAVYTIMFKVWGYIILRFWRKPTF